MTKGLPEAAHFALAPLPQHHRQPGVACCAVEHLDFGRLEPLPSHDHPLREPPQCVLTRPARDHDTVFLFDMVAGVHQPSRQLAIVGQQHQSPAVEIEPANREDARPSGWQAISYGPPTPVITNAGQQADRLVHHQVGPLRDRLDRLAANGHPVEPWGDLLAGNGRRPVH